MSTEDRLYEFLAKLTGPINEALWRPLVDKINKILEEMDAPYQYNLDQHGIALLLVKTTFAFKICDITDRYVGSSRHFDAVLTGELRATQDARHATEMIEIIIDEPQAKQLEETMEKLRAGLHPQGPPNDKLECGGWKCGCGLVPATGPLSKGPLPRGHSR